MAKMTAGGQKKQKCIRGHDLDETRVLCADGNYRCRVCRNFRQREFTSRNGGSSYTRNQNLKRQYDITSEEWERLFKNQNNKCAICLTEVTKVWHTDHNHTTGAVRGILCAACNRNLAGYEAMLPHKAKVEDYLL